MKTVVYTCITGGYDKLYEVKFLSKGVDYICFTDDETLKSTTWTIRKIPDELKNLSNVKKQRLIKICPHKYLPEYDVSLWVDSNIEITQDLTLFFQSYDLYKHFLYANKHPTRDSIYTEMIAVLKLKKDVFETVNPQINRYREEGYPEHDGMIESNILLRKHNDKQCVRLMNLWAEEVKLGSHRDQLSFNYCVWKLGLTYGLLRERYAKIRPSDSNNFMLHRHIPNAIINGVTSERIEEYVKELKAAELEANKVQTQLEEVSNQQKKFIENSWPIVSVVFFTHARTKCAANCLDYLIRNLKYPNLNWILSTDRSTNEHISKLLEQFPKNGISISDVTVISTKENAYGLPNSMNNGLKEAFSRSEFCLRCEDDWILWKPLLLNKYVSALNNQDVGCIRLAMLSNGLDAERYNDCLNRVVGSKSHAWLMNNQVALVHKRLHDKLGYYETDSDSDQSETKFRDAYNNATNFGRFEFLKVLVPKEMKQGTLDDPSLWFIHVGRSELGHTYKEPARYSWIYSSNEKTKSKTQTVQTKNRNAANIFDISSLFKHKNQAPQADLVPPKIEKQTDEKIDKYPPISIMMTTHNRTAVASFCLKSLIKNLKYNGSILWIICDDKSEPGHTEALENEFKLSNVENYKICKTTDERWGLGASMNNGLKAAFEYGDIVLTTEDDWYLRKEYDINDKVALLAKDETIAGIRIGALCNELGACLRPNMIYGEYYKLEAPRNKPGRFYIFNNQVMLRHKRIFDKIGYMKENCPTSEQEETMVKAYNDLTDFGRSDNFKTLWPRNYDIATVYGLRNPFFHIGRSTRNGITREIKNDFNYLNDEKLDKRIRDIFTRKSILENFTIQKGSNKENLPTISVVIMTSDNTRLSYSTVDSLLSNLKYDGKIKWIISGSSNKKHIEALYYKFKNYNVSNDDLIICDTTDNCEKTQAINSGLQEAFKLSEIVLLFDDNWYLHELYDINSFVEILNSDNTVGGIMLGELSSGKRVSMNESAHEDFFKINYKINNRLWNIFDNQISIFHKRTFDKVGLIKENCSQLERETEFISKLNENKDIQILWPKQYKLGTPYSVHNSFYYIGEPYETTSSENIKTQIQDLNTLFIEENKMEQKIRAIVSMTSYPARISNVSKAINYLLLKQSRKPDEIHLWLSTEEFPNKENDLPAELVETIKNPKVFLHWLDKNIYVHKRHEIFKIANENDCIFFMDDDTIYNENLIDMIMKEHIAHKNCIICYTKYSSHMYADKKILYGRFSKPFYPYVNKFRWCGQCMIPAKLYPKVLLSEEMQKTRNTCSPISDECWMQPWIVYNNIPIYYFNFGWGTEITTDKNAGQKTGLVSYSHQKEKNGYERRDNWLYNTLRQNPKLLDKYKQLYKYGSELDNSIPIIVSMTSWEKRINNVCPVVKSLLNNTVKPNLIVCNLSIEEFPNKENDLPIDLIELTRYYNFEINWVEKNTNVFKKFIPTLRRFYGKKYFLFTVDDDELYDETYIETGLKALRSNKAAVIAKRKSSSTGVWGGFFCCHASIFDKSYWENITEELINERMNDPYTDRYLQFKNIKIASILESHNTKYNEVFPNRNGSVYSPEKKQKVLKLVDDIFSTKQFN